MIFNHVQIEFPPEPIRIDVDGIRHYEIPNTDKRYVSVTNVTSFTKGGKIEEWRKRIGDEEADKILFQSSYKGNQFHDLCYHYLQNHDLEKPKSPLAWYGFVSAKPILHRINNIIAQERAMYSHVLQIAGTVDCIADFTGKSGIPELAVIDFKSSKKEKKIEWIENYFMQAAAYAAMLYELTGICVKKLVIIITCEDGSVVFYEKYNVFDYIRKLNKAIYQYYEAKQS